MPPAEAQTRRSPLLAVLAHASSFQGGAAILAMTLIGFLYWTLDRGFDLTDEGFYLLSAQFPDDVIIWPNSAHYYIGALYNIAQGSVMGTRLLGITLNLLSSLFLWAGFVYWVRIALPALKTTHGLSILGMVALGGLLAYGANLTTPSYNSVTAFGLKIACASFLVWASATPAIRMSRSSSLAVSGILGVAIGLTFFAKFTSAMGALILFLVLIVLWPGVSGREKAQAMEAVIGGFLLWLGVHFLFIQRPDQWWDATWTGIQMVMTLTPGYKPSGQIRYILEVLDMFGRALLDFGVAHIAAFGGFVGLRVWCARSSPWRARHVRLLWITVIVLAAIMTAFGGLVQGGEIRYENMTRVSLGWVLLLTNIAVLAAMFWRKVTVKVSFLKNDQHKQLVLVLGLLLALPFVGALGTGGGIFAPTRHHLASWWLILCLCLIFIERASHTKIVWHGATALLAASACAIVISGVLFAPYQLSAPMLEQVVLTPVGRPVSNLKLDAATSRFLSDIRGYAKAAGVSESDYVLAYFSMPGAVFAIGARSPGIPWFSGNWPGSRAASEMALARAPPHALKRLHMLEIVGRPEFMPDLAKFGIQFPSGFVLIGETIHPRSGDTVRFWQRREEPMTALPSD